MKKILIIRFSSIGDIVLTSPLIRCLKLQRPDLEIHYLTKPPFKPVLENNPYIHTIHYLEPNIKDSINSLKKESFSYIIDLHKNIRSFRIISGLNIKHSSFPKLNLKKWWYVQTKKNVLPSIHIVDRYFKAATVFDINNDLQGLDYFLSPSDTVNTLPEKVSFTVIVCGGAHATKQIPVEKIDYLCQSIHSQIILLGGNREFGSVQFLEQKYAGKVHNGCGIYKLNQSAYILKEASLVITPDTGLMHMAAAFQKTILSVWGNTVPAFGMYAYMPQHPERSFIYEVEGLPCRPCSKIGYEKCPKKHFHCMNQINWNKLQEKANEILLHST